MVERLADRVGQAPMTALLGPSGSGKSSLVQAGLLPALHKRRGTRWHLLSLRPGSDPLAALAAAFDSPPAGAGLTERLAYRYDAAGRLRRGDVSLRQLAESVLASLPPAARLLLVIDQWEELYTQARRSEGGIDDVARFVALIFEANAAERFHSLLVLRTDFYEEASRHPGMPQCLAERQVPVEAIRREGLRRAITEPAGAVGLRFEHGLPERILDDVGDEPGNLPLLEHALRELWGRRQEKLLTFEAYEAIGGVRRAIAERASQTYRSLTLPAQVAARRLLVSLVAPREGRDDVRTRLPMPEDPESREVIRRFTARDVRLLVTGPGEGGGRATVELSHEALIRSWEELRQWVKDRRDALRIRERIRADMAHWDQKGRDLSLLLPKGRRLEEARTLLREDRNILIDDVRPFIEASVRRDAWQNRKRYASVAAFIAFLMGISGGMYELREQAESELSRAIETDGRRLAQIARRYLESGQPHRAIMVAREAFGPLRESLPERQRLYVWQAADVLHKAMAARPILRKVFRGHTRVVNMATFSPDGKRIASAGVDGRVFILDARTLAVEQLIIPNPETFNDDVFGRDDSVDWVAFSPDGARLATGNEDGSVRIFSVRDGKQVQRFQAHPSAVGSLSFTPDGSTLLTTSGFSLGGGKVQQAKLWNIADGTLLHSIIDKSDCCVGQGVVSPDGARAAVVESNVVSVWELNTGTKLLHFGIVEEESLAFSLDGERLATGDSDHLVRIWDARSGAELRALRGHNEDVLSVAFSPDGRFFVTASQDSTVWLWDFPHPAPARLLQDEGNVGWFVYSPDGSLIAASGNEGALVWRPGKDKAVRLGDVPGGRTRKSRSARTARVYSSLAAHVATKLSSMTRGLSSQFERFHPFAPVLLGRGRRCVFRRMG